MTRLVQEAVVQKWDQNHAKGSEKRFPNLDLVRLEKWFFESKPGRLLEYGFGCGVNLFYLLEMGHKIDALDVSSAAKKNLEAKLNRLSHFQGRVRLHLLPQDARNLPFENETFDYIVCVSVLSLLGSQMAVEALLREFQRILKKGGKLIVDINGSESDFARESKYLGNDIYQYVTKNKEKEPAVSCYCPRNADALAMLMKQHFNVDDVGFSTHKYFHSAIQEFIVCAHKSF